MFAACRAQWQGENYSLYWVLLEHKMHIKPFLCPHTPVCSAWLTRCTNILVSLYTSFCRQESSVTRHMLPTEALSHHTCSAAAQLATTDCLPLKGWSVIIPYPSLTQWHVLQQLLPSTVQNHSAKGYVLCTAGTICIQPLKLPLLSQAWGRKQGITVLGEERLRVCNEPQGSQSAKLTTLAKR